MNIDLEKIDIIRQRMDVGYREAREALTETGGDVIEALAFLEEKKRPSGILYHRGKEIAARIGTLIEKGNRTKLIVKKEDRTLLEVPANLGVLALITALASTEFALIGAIGATTALAKDYIIELERPEEDHPRGEVH